VGGNIWLVTGHLDDIGDNEWFGSFGDYFVVGQAHHNSVKHAFADGNGNFELSDVPAGAYTLVLQSNHSKGATLRDMRGKVELRKVQIRAGETFDASRDFGMTED
jgi:hypothetical protein